MIIDEHLRLLCESGIVPDRARHFGIKSLTAQEVSERFDIPAGAGLYFPYFSLEGEEIGGRLKLEKPLKDGAKYLQKAGTSLHAYFHPDEIEDLKNPDIELYVTEGEKKGIVLREIVEGPAVSYPGCWNWKAKDHPGLAGVWQEIPLENRVVFFIPDSDFFLNPKVHEAGEAFVKALLARGARVRLIDMRLDDKTRLGVDDFLMKAGKDEFQRRIDKPFWAFEHVDTSALPRQLPETTLDDVLRKSLFTEGLKLASLLTTLAKSSSLSAANIKTHLANLKKEWRRLAPKKRNENDLLWWKEDVNQRALFDEIGKRLEAKKDVFYEVNTENIAFVDRRGLHRILDGKDFSSFLASFAGFKKVKLNEKGRLVSNDGYQLLGKDLGRAFLAYYDAETVLPPLKLFTRCPVLSGNELIYSLGYHEKAGIFYDGPELRPSYSLEHIKQALDFPYENEAHFTNALGILLSAVLLREECVGAHPMATIRGDHTDLGKSTLAKTIAYVASGLLPAPAVYTSDELEFEKKMGAFLKGNDFVVIDNIKSSQPIASAFLEAALTSETIETRVLQHSVILKRRNNVQIFATLNEGSMCSDLLTRSVTIFLTHERKLKDANPLNYVKKYRNEVLAEILGLVLNWKKKGCPRVPVFFPKYPDWAALVNGILEANGIKGFLSTHKETSAKLNPEIATFVEVGGEELWRLKKNHTETKPAAYWRTLAEQLNPKLLKDYLSPRAKDVKASLILKSMKGKTYEFTPADEGSFFIRVMSRKSTRGGAVKDYFYEVLEGHGKKIKSSISNTPDTSPLCEIPEILDEKSANTPLETDDYIPTDISDISSLLEEEDKKIFYKKNSFSLPSSSPLEISEVFEAQEDPNSKEEFSDYSSDKPLQTGVSDASWQVPLKSLPTYSLDGKDYPARWWDGEFIGDTLSFDVETEKIEGGDHIPFLVLASAFNGQALYFIELHRLREFAKAHEQAAFIGHNIAFDLSVVSNQIQDRRFGFRKAARQEALDTWILARLLNLATEGDAENKKGRFSLATLCRERLGLSLPKELMVDGKEVRTSYGDYAGRIKEAPAAYFHYNAFDTMATFFLWQKLKAEAEELALAHQLEPAKLLSHYVQVADAFAAFVTSRLGFRVDQKKVQENGGLLREKIAETDALLKENYGYEGGKGQKERFNVTMQAIEKEKGVSFPRYFDKTSQKTLISQKKTALKPFTGIEFLELYQKRQHLNKFLKMSVLPLEGLEKVHPHISILKNTGRNGMSRPNLQQIPRERDFVDMRAQLVASPGHILYIADYASAELVSLAQICFDRYRFSRLGEAINSGQDVHKITAAKFLSKSPEEVSKEERQYGKIANFGLPGGLGIPRLVDYARDSYGVVLTPAEAIRIKEAWLSSFPEMKLYLAEADKQLAGKLLQEEHPHGFADNLALHVFFRILSGHTQTRTSGRVYSDRETRWAWESASLLLARYPQLEAFRASIEAQKAVPELVHALKNMLTAVLPRSGRVRANCSYTEFNNTPFQGLLADITNTAWFRLVRQGFKVVCVIHDEFVVEVEESQKDVLAKEIEAIMQASARHYCPQVRMGIEGHFSPAWDKG